MKKTVGKIVLAVIGLLVFFVYYYVTLPAISIHSAGLWWFVMIALLVIGVVLWIRKMFQNKDSEIIQKGGKINIKLPNNLGALKFLFGLVVVLFLIFIVGTFLSSPVINAGKYKNLLNITECNFTDDITEADFNTIPLLDKASASILGNRKMGSMVDMVSQFEVADDYAQINYKGKPYRVTPLTYASPIKWLTNHKNGIPAYIRINMTTQDTECVKLPAGNGIKYSKSEYFNRNIYRHLRFRYPSYIFGEQIFFEIGEDDIPYWVCPVIKFNIGLFGGKTIGRVVVCNAQTGECMDYPVEDVPQWVDKVYQAELLVELYDYHGSLAHGFLNSILGQKDCLQTTNGYNYLAMNDDVWVYSGVTSVSGDESNVGFVLMNQRTMETRFYKVEGAVEASAMSSAEGQVQNLGYVATFPLLVNVSGEPTYFMALKDSAGLVKKYAMVNIQKYQWVAIGDTVNECKKSYTALLKTNGITSTEEKEAKQITGKIIGIAPVMTDGNTRYYAYLEGMAQPFEFDLSDMELLPVIKYQTGDTITIVYLEDDTVMSARSIIEGE